MQAKLWKKIGHEDKEPQKAESPQITHKPQNNPLQIEQLDLSLIKCQLENKRQKSNLKSINPNPNNISQLLNLSFNTEVPLRQSQITNVEGMKKSSYRKIIINFGIELKAALNEFKIELMNIKQNAIVGQQTFKQSLNPELLNQHLNNLFIQHKNKLQAQNQVHNQTIQQLTKKLQQLEHKNQQQSIIYQQNLSQLNHQLQQHQRQNQLLKQQKQEYWCSLQKEVEAKTALQDQYTKVLEFNEELTKKCTKLEYELLLKETREEEWLMKRQNRAFTVGTPQNINNSFSTHPHYENDSMAHNKFWKSGPRTTKHKQLNSKVFLQGQQNQLPQLVSRQFMPIKPTKLHFQSKQGQNPDPPNLGNLQSRIQQIKRQLRLQIQVAKGEMINN